jgi:hypothetical protein
LPELCGGFAVAEQAERAEVVEVALAAAFGYGADVVGVPEAAATGDGLHAVESEACGAGWASCALEGVVGGDGVDVADGADAAIAREDLVAEVAGVGAETPLVDAVVAAEGAAALGENFEIAPAAERQAVRPSGKRGCGLAAAGEGAGDKRFRCQLSVLSSQFSVLSCQFSGLVRFRSLLPGDRSGVAAR